MTKRKSEAVRKAKRPNTIFQLWARFAKAVIKMEATPTAAKPGKISNPAFDRAVSKASDIANLIVVHRADCIEEMQLKIKAALWCANGLPFAELDDWKPGPYADNEQTEALVSLRRDLDQLQEENRLAVKRMLKLYRFNPEGKARAGE